MRVDVKRLFPLEFNEMDQTTIEVLHTRGRIGIMHVDGKTDECGDVSEGTI